MYLLVDSISQSLHLFQGNIPVASENLCSEFSPKCRKVALRIGGLLNKYVSNAIDFARISNKC
jgi:hypothetical protein